MKILVCGGRDFDDFGYLETILDEYLVCRGELVIIQGGARGADKLAEDWAYMNYIPCIRHPANWDIYRKAAGPIRNQEMIDFWSPDLVIAFPGGSGTADMVNRSKKAGITVKEV